MTPAQRDLAQQLFEEAIRGGTPDASAWIATRTLDGQVAAEVKRLLSQHGSHATHAESTAQPPVRLADALIGQMLGGYRIDRMIGAGGMGRVYLGVSEMDSSHEAAMKVLGRSVSGPIALSRFEREREVMARLKHPGIAAFYDGGMYDDGAGAVPWFAMELIANATELADWCEKRNLGLRARLSLVAEVSDAIGHAHRAGIVHRDLKPANILVTETGEPKVIDFGVARCMGTDSGSTAVQTQTGQLVGTMQYMSPEQFAGDPRKIDARADVYALGVILYELIANTYPHDVRALSVSDAARIVCEVDAPDIRSVASEIDDALAALVAKCLARARADRFDDAGAVSQSLRRWLRGESSVGLVPMMDSASFESVPPGKRARGAAHPLEQVSIQRSSGWMIPAVSMILVALVVLVATGIVTPNSVVRWWQMFSTDVGAGSPDPTSTTAVEPISIVTDPAGARVTIDGLEIGVTPTSSTISWTATSTSASIHISLAGFKPQTHVIAAAPRGGRTAPLQMRVRLDPVAEPTVP